MGEATTSKATRFETPLATDTVLATQRLWETPLMLNAFWWNTGVEAFWPDMPRLHHAAHHDQHDQLVVPQPIEVTGEPALFA